ACWRHTLRRRARLEALARGIVVAFNPPQKGIDMRIARIALTLTLATFVASTARAQKVTTEVAPGTNLGTYKTFAWLKQPNVADPILKQRIVDDINRQLTAKGYRLVADGGDL